MANAPGMNPILTTNAAGSFSVQSNGLMQGMVFDDPETRYSLAAGILSTAETLPMWGGVGIFERIPADGQNPLGPVVGRAASFAALAGFSVFNQAHNGITTPQSNVPMMAGGMSVSYHRLGSRQRLAVACSAALVAAAPNSATNFAVGWDLTNQQLIPYQTVASTVTISSITWATGVATVTTAAAHGLSNGAYVNITGAVPAGYNGTYQVTVTGTTTFTYILATNPGAETTPGTVTAASAQLPVRVLSVNGGNSKVVTYDSINNFANWNVAGNAAVILI
ncbi:hypothetical protein [Martelella alba]|uniref:Uncharacterized protein n=1 Tax=Martelella alba TaxID=2590451 RepID=A0ABY2SDS3_9HYPH|nr:hypothetical protein [Martelella alba]TKI02733.1 hypothetical protein FCN80_24125 [Martelella alba]